MILDGYKKSVTSCHFNFYVVHTFLLYAREKEQVCPYS